MGTVLALRADRVPAREEIDEQVRTWLAAFVERQNFAGTVGLARGSRILIELSPSRGGNARKRHHTDFVLGSTVERELTIDEALQLQTYQAAIKGSKMAVRAVLKMIEKREAALAKKAPPQPVRPRKFGGEEDPRNADAAMLLLGITVPDPSWEGPCKYGTRMKLATWAAQAGISRPGRRQLWDKDRVDIKRQTINSDALKWPRQRGAS